MLEVDGLVAFVLFGLWIYCVFDVITTDESLCRNLPKLMWLMIVFFVPDIGSIAWLIAGRPERGSFRIGESSRPRRYVAPEDRPSYGVDMDNLSPIVREREEQAQLRVREEQLRRREEELRQREAALRRQDEEPPPPATAPET